MKKIVAGFLVCCLLLNSMARAEFIERKTVIREEKLIPFDVEFNSPEGIEKIDISHLKNVKVMSYQTENGDMAVRLKDGILRMEFFDGVKGGSEEIIKTEVVEIEDVEYNEERKAVIIEPKYEPISITEISGAFQSGSIDSAGNIVLKVKGNAEYEVGVNEEKIGFAEIEFAAEKGNRERNFVSEWVDLPYEPIEDSFSVIGDTSTVQDVEVKDNSIRVHFSGGTPKLNAEYETAGYTYFWIDRYENGTFRKYDPNSVYTTDRNVISGEGTYLDKKDFDEIGVTLKSKDWTDFCGVEIDGKKYIYCFDESKGLPTLESGEFFTEDILEVEEGEFNTEKYTVEFSNAGVSYIPEGKLFSMGNLVPNTKGWGSEEKNQSWESKTGFFNPITNKWETYVKHYKFFYGPTKKTAFGGYYTYPYQCKVKYEHYLPVKLYSGEVCYEYKSTERSDNYHYSGYVKVAYDAEKNVKDYAPSAPYNIAFHKGTQILNWHAGSDDYTLEKDLRYEVQIQQNGVWKTKIETQAGETSLKLSDSFEDIRIRTIDSADLKSSWGKLEKSQITLTGRVEPYAIHAGEEIDLFANTKSFYDVVSVKAENEALNVDVSLFSENKETPDFHEISYELVEDFLEDDTAINFQNIRHATNESGTLEIQTFGSGIKETDNGFSIKLPEIGEFERSGTVILANENSRTLPTDFFVNDEGTWHLYFSNCLYFRNQESNQLEKMLEIVSETEKELKPGQFRYFYTVVPKLRIHSLRYEEDGSPIYYTIEINKSLLTKPVTMTWNTDVSGATKVTVHCGDKKTFSFQREYEEIKKVFSGFERYEFNKKLVRYTRAASGYYLARNGIKNLKWTEWIRFFGFDSKEAQYSGIKVRKNERFNKESVESYNHSGVQNAYRLLFMDEEMSQEALERYWTLLEGENRGIDRKDESSIYGNQVLQQHASFSKKQIPTSISATPGVYPIRIIATDKIGNTAVTEVFVNVYGGEKYLEKEPEKEKDEEGTIQGTSGKAPILGRFYYEDDSAYLEELKQPQKVSNSEGFLCAGETLMLYLELKNTDSLLVNLAGDESITTVDSLTKRFLCDEGERMTEEELEKSCIFPKILLPVAYDETTGTSTFQLKYVIPYGTKQTLHSWSTLKTSALEAIDKSKLFNRISAPYTLKIYPNQDLAGEKKIKFDVFERWDTVLNRDVSSYLKNSSDRKKVSLGGEG